MNFQKVSIIGLGYIGLPTAAVIAGRRVKVVGVDISRSVVETINQGGIHIVEPDLDLLVRAVVSQGYLRATTTPEAADAFIIAVPTPVAPTEKGQFAPDLSFIEAASRSIAPHLRRGNLIVLESTSPVGTTEKMERLFAELRPDLTFPTLHGETSDIRIAYCPERVLPGRVLRELIDNDRIVGGVTPACSARAVALYSMFVEGDCTTTDCRTAEMAKLTENSFRDVNIAFANELSIICDRLGIDVWELISLANRHPRVDILRPGPGVGGHCIAVDPWFIVSSAPDEARLIRAARQVNDAKPLWVLGKIFEAIERTRARMGTAGQSSLTVACYGLAFKPDIDDLRESPAAQIVEALASSFKGRLLVVEPHIDRLPPSLGGPELVSLSQALADADVHIVLVGHSAFAACEVLRGIHDADFSGVFASGAWSGRSAGAQPEARDVPRPVMRQSGQVA